MSHVATHFSHPREEEMNHSKTATAVITAAVLFILAKAIASAAEARPLKVAIVVSDGVELLDFAGVAEHTAQYMEYHWSPDIRYAAGYSVQDPMTHAAK